MNATKPWRYLSTGLLGAIMLATVAWPSPSIAEETGLSNNLSVPTIFVPSVGVGTPVCTAVDDTVLPDPALVSLIYPGYWVQGEATWQADCDIAADNTMSATAAWGDNLAGQASLRVGQPVRVELGLVADATAYSMTGFDVEKLQLDLLDRESLYGTNDGSGIPTYSEVRVWNAGVMLDIAGPSTLSLPFVAELNSTGRVVYGYNWRPAVAGTYTITATVPTVTVVGTDLGTFAAHTATITVEITDSAGGGGGDDGGGGGGETNTAPVAVDDSYSVPQGTTASFLVLANDTDVDGDPLTITGVGTPGTGSATIGTGAQSISYTALSTFVGIDSFTYTVSDGQGGSDTATVTVSVTAGSGGGGGGTGGGVGGGGAVPVPPQGLGGGGGGTRLLDVTLDPTTDATVVNGEPTVIARSSDGRVKISIPVKALRSRGSIHVVANRVDLEAAVPHPLHHPVGSLLDVGDQTYDLQVLDAAGSAITTFETDLEIAVQIDPTTVDLHRVWVLSWDETTTGWMTVPTTTSSDGTVTFTTDHLSVFAMFELPEVTRTLRGGLNGVTFTGPDGTTPQQFAAEFGTALMSMFRFNAETQSFESYIVGAPAAVQTLTQLRTRDAVTVRLTAGAAVEYHVPAIVPAASGLRQQPLRDGLNAVAVTTPRSYGPGELFFALGDAVETVLKFDTASDTWLTWTPGGPAFVNSLATINPYEVVWVRTRAGFGPRSLDLMEADAEGHPMVQIMAASDDVAEAIRERDASRLQLLSCDGEPTCTQDQQQRQARDAERQQLAACVSTGSGYNVLTRSIVLGEDGRTATVQVHLGVHLAGGEPQLLQQEWTFRLSTEGEWRSTNVPACPFK